MRQDYLPFGKPNFSEEEIEAVSRVMRSGWIGMGQEVIAFEQELARFCGAKHVITVDSCTSALFLSLKVNGVGEGDEVIIPSLTWCSTANAAIYCGAKPVFCDIDEETLCLTPDHVLKQITTRTRAVMVVHYGGLTVNIEELRKVLPDHIKIIEDAAHAFGSKYSNGKMVGNSGNLTCFSFYANKNLSTGEGGAIALNDNELADKIRSLRQHGMPVNAWKRFTNPKAMIYSQLEQLGYKMNYIDLHACIGRIQLKRFSEFHKIRQHIGKRYFNELKEIKPVIRFQNGLSEESHAKHLYVIKLPLKEMKITRDEFLVEMRDKNIGASIHYMPLHMMDYYKKNFGPQSLPVSEKVFDEIITLPVSATMNDSDITDVIETTKLILTK
ncbi:MAG TPA: DegT/DnrJ/EryC1/StrS family aminotransferase [Bacteroidia bacterium]|jgi:perosamine synthetase|nr:DegT/DnrJ/EryC1/StrS family aminotransferase [Bacteroidia bacterium]